MPSILITGCSTGIGRATALKFSKKGYTVFAGVRKDSDADSLKAEDQHGHIVPVILDLTNDDQLASVNNLLNEELADIGLNALVNNAGADIGGAIEYVDPEIVRFQHEVNVIGPLKLIQSVMPLIRQARGRIVNIGSIVGKVSLPLEGPYSMSKFALEAMTDALRFELSKAGIHVSLIEPGPILTPMMEDMGGRLQKVLDSLPSEGAAYYSDLVLAMKKASAELPSRAKKPADVADLIVHAVESPRPKTRYLITQDAKLLNFMKWLLPDRAFDALLRQQYLS